MRNLVSIIGALTSISMSSESTGEQPKVEDVNVAELADVLKSLVPDERSAFLLQWNRHRSELNSRRFSEAERRWLEGFSNSQEPSSDHDLIGEWFGGRDGGTYLFKQNGSYELSRRNQNSTGGWRILRNGEIVLKTSKGGVTAIKLQGGEFTRVVDHYFLIDTPAPIYRKVAHKD